MWARWLVQRVSSSVLVLFVALTINFTIPRLMPGSPVDFFAAGTGMTPAARQAIIERFGLDQPLWGQFGHYLVNSFKGDFGLSYFYYPLPVSDMLADTLPWTLLILICSIILQVIIGYVLGVTAAWKVGTKVDTILQTTSLAIFSIPMFWIAMVLLFVFGVELGWFPLSGCYTVGATYSSIFDQAADIMRHAALPIIAITIARYAGGQLILRNTMVSTLKEQYILTAEAKGLSERTVKYKHAARNALLPMVTFQGISLALTIGGVIYVETVFSYLGIGKLILDSVMHRDYPMLQGCFFVFSVMVILINFLVDLIYVYLDPRIRY